MSTSSTALSPSGAATVPPGVGAVVIVGAATIEAALSDPSDSNYIYQPSPTTAQSVRFTLTYVPPAGLHTDYLQPYFRHAYDSAVGWFYPTRVTGYRTNDGTPHAINLPSTPTPAPGLTLISIQAASGFVSDKAADGTPWADCNRFDVEWAIHVTYDNASPPRTEYGGGTLWPKLSLAQLIQAYTTLPSSAVQSPSGTTVTSPQPGISWYPPSVMNQTQSAHRAIIVPTGATDAAGVAVGATGFDPTTVANLPFDSGKVISGAYSILPAGVNSLLNGTYYVYLQTWTPMTQGDLSGPWTHGAAFTVATDNVNPPTVSLSNHTATNTVQVTIAPGATTGGYRTPELYEVQVFDALAGWVAAPILNGTVTGNVTSTFFDGLQRPGSTVQYRARGRYLRGDGLKNVSPWVTASLAVADPHQWWLRHPTDRTLNRSLSDTAALLIRDWQPTRARPQTVAWGIGAKYATITHDVVKSTTAAVTVWAMNAAALADLRVLIEGDEDIVLVTPWSEMFRVQVGNQITETAIRAAPRFGETGPLGLVRQVAFSLIEVAPV